MVVWLTGLPSSGKTTLGKALVARFTKAGKKAVLIDGDQLRRGPISKHLSFTWRDRETNALRAAAVAQYVERVGGIAVCCFVSPYMRVRQAVQKMIGPERFVLVHVSCLLSVCMQRDVKGLYASAARGEITGLTGHDAPYEAPRGEENPIVVDTATNGPDKSVEMLLHELREGVAWREPNTQNQLA